VLTGLCQQFNVVGEHPLPRLAWYGLRMGYGVRTNLKRIFPSQRAGEPSRFAEGDWVRVLDAERIRATLDPRSRTRGLLFLDYQWPFCGGTYRVQRVMTRMIDDSGIFRPISRTVLLEGVDCGGVSGREGCGRHCPIMFRDEWLEPAAAPAPRFERVVGSCARVRPLAEIRATLDWLGKRDGLMFMPEMERWCGGVFRVTRRVQRVFECESHTRPRSPIYILDGLQCSGAVLAKKGPCDRRCSILWHADWLSDDL
jgi:hypothetical protein